MAAAIKEMQCPVHSHRAAARPQADTATNAVATTTSTNTSPRAALRLELSPSLGLMLAPASLAGALD